jgi:hypothetical protein
MVALHPFHAPLLTWAVPRLALQPSGDAQIRVGAVVVIRLSAMLDVSHLGVDRDDHVIAVNGWREHPILGARIVLGHALKFTPCQRSHTKESASITPSSGLCAGVIKW